MAKRAPVNENSENAATPDRAPKKERTRILRVRSGKFASVGRHLGSRLTRADDQILLLAQAPANLTGEAQAVLAAIHARVADRLRPAARCRGSRQGLAIQGSQLERRSRGARSFGADREGGPVSGRG